MANEGPAETTWQGADMGWAEDWQQRVSYMSQIVDRFALLEYYIRRTLMLLLSADPVAVHVFATQASAGEMKQ